MLHKIMRLAVIACCIILLCTGCWDSLDIQKKDIAMAIFTDVEEAQYKTYIEIVKTMGGGDGENQPQAAKNILFGEGATIDQASQRLDAQSDNPVYLDEMRVLVIGGNLAEKGIETYLNRARGTPGYRKNLYVLTTQTDMDELIKLQPDNNIYLGMSLEDKIDNLYQWGRCHKVLLQDLLATVGVSNVGFVMPIVNAQDKSLTIDGYAIFSNFIRVGIIPPPQINGITYLLSDKATFMYPVNKNDNEYYFSATMKNRKIKTYFANGKATFDITVNVDTVLNYSSKFIDFTETQVNEMSGKVASLIEQDINQAVYMSQKNIKCDYLGLFNFFRASYPDVFKNNDWKSIYENANIHVNVISKYTGAGMQELER